MRENGILRRSGWIGGKEMGRLSRKRCREYTRRALEGRFAGFAAIGFEREIRAKGAGIIIFQKNRVSGLTTAAGLGVTASIGL